MTSAGLNSGLYENEVPGELRTWRQQMGKGVTPSSSTGFKLPDGSMYSPDASWISDEKVANGQNLILLRFQNKLSGEDSIINN